jgi:hypothetical protein
MWSLQYIFMRVAVPVFGIAVVAEGRALFAALFLLPWVAWVARERIGLREHWRDHLVIASTIRRRGSARGRPPPGHPRRG